MDTISASLAKAIRAQKKRLRKLRKIREMVVFLDRRRQNLPVIHDRRGKM